MSSSSKEARRRSRKPSMETTVERNVIMPATVGRWRKNLQPFSVLRSFEQAQAANRVSKKIAAARAGKPHKERSKGSKTADRKPRSENDELLRTLAARLAENGPDADRLRRAISESMGKDCFDSQERAD